MAFEKLERHPDRFDQASELEARHRKAAIEAIQQQLKESDPDFDGENCVECGAEMPALRLAMCRIRCVGCQSELEYKNRTRRI